MDETESSYPWETGCHNLNVDMKTSRYAAYQPLAYQGLTPEQRQILIDMRIPPHWGCTAQLINKEHNMERINVNSLLKLADKSYAEEVASHGGSLPKLLQEALQEQLRDREKAAANAAASEIIALLGNAEQIVENEVKSIRRSRELIAQSKDRLSKIARAKAYGLESSNFLPLVHALGLSYRTDDHFDTKLLEVPSDWVDPATAVKQDVSE